MSIKKQYDYNDAYQKEHIKRIVVKLNDLTDMDIIRHLQRVNDGLVPGKKKKKPGEKEGEKTQTYIKRLIREDMEK